MVHVSDALTQRDYAFRPPGGAGAPDPTSLASSAATMLARGDWGPLRYLLPREEEDAEAGMAAVERALAPKAARVVISQATGDEFAEVWRQGREGGERRLTAFANPSTPIDRELQWLQNVVIDILLESQENGSVLPGLQSISLMAVSRMTKVRFFCCFFLKKKGLLENLSH